MPGFLGWVQGQVGWLIQTRHSVSNSRTNCDRRLHRHRGWRYLPASMTGASYPRGATCLANNIGGALSPSRGKQRGLRGEVSGTISARAVQRPLLPAGLLRLLHAPGLPALTVTGTVDNTSRRLWQGRLNGLGSGLLHRNSLEHWGTKGWMDCNFRGTYRFITWNQAGWVRAKYGTRRAEIIGFRGHQASCGRRVTKRQTTASAAELQSRA